MRDIFSFFEKQKEATYFNALRIGVASPKTIRRNRRAFGSVIGSAEIFPARSSQAALG